MKTDPDELAHPVTFVNPQGVQHNAGLTKREDFTKAAMQGLLAHPKYGLMSAYQIGNLAVEVAGATIDSLNGVEEDT